ncbi:MAG: nitrate ABC transporter substrate-binding protein [Pseudomonadota bacterium]
MFSQLRTFVAAASLTVLGAPAVAVDSPLAETVTDRVQDCRAGTSTTMPLIAWGADGVTIEANGGALQPGSGAFAEAGWTLELAVKDDFAAQVSDYLTCDSPFLRGTLGMLMAASPVTEADARTEQVVIYKHSWSAGDGIVAVDGISNAADLANKRIAVQAYGPHIDFVARILDDAGLSVDDVDIIWTADLTGTADSPAAVLERGEADAAAVILPDARVLTSGGAVGTGAEGSVRGATILVSTQEATAVIGDYISVRRDYFDANRDAIAALVNAMFRTEEKVRGFMARDGSPDQTRLSTVIADELLGGLPPEEGVFLWRDAISDGWPGNARHFGDPKDPRRYDVLAGEINAALIGADVIERPVQLAIPGWDYRALAEGLSDLTDREIAAFDPEAAAAAVQRLRRTGQLDANTKIDFSVFFEPDSNDFPAELYARDFEEILRLAATYSGAIITVEGHADPLYYLRQERDGASNQELKAIRTSALNLSLDRAISVVDALEGYAGDEGIRVNRNQFTVDGVGINAPLHNPPATEAEWRENMRVVFRILTTQAEATEFSPL